MKINVNKETTMRLFAGIITPVILAGSMVAYSACIKSSSENLNIETNNDDQVLSVDTINYNVLKDCYFIEILNPDYDLREYYITYKDLHGTVDSNVRIYSYVDVSSKMKVFAKYELDSIYGPCDESNRILFREIKLEDYLYSNLKSEYTAEDIENIKSDLIEKYSNKSLVKE